MAPSSVCGAGSIPRETSFQLKPSSSVLKFGGQGQLGLCACKPVDPLTPCRPLALSLPESIGQGSSKAQGTPASQKTAWRPIGSEGYGAPCLLGIQAMGLCTELLSWGAKPCPPLL